MTSKSELAAMHLRAEHLKASLGSRVKQRNFLSDPKAWTEHQVKRHSVNLNCLKISLLFSKARSIGKLSLIVKEIEILITFVPIRIIHIKICIVSFSLFFFAEKFNDYFTIRTKERMKNIF